MIVWREYRFEAAHRLEFVPEGHKCATMHGHSYRVRLEVGGEMQQPQEWILDFAEIDAVAKPVIDQLDHTTLNDIVGLGNPTVEALSVWLWNAIQPGLPGLCAVEAQETERSGCRYEGPATFN